MNKKILAGFAGFALTAVVAMGSVAWAADSAADVVTLREGLMIQIKNEFGIVKGAVDAGRAPDAAAVEAAENLAVLARLIPKNYPKGTENVASGAKPEVWTQAADFKAHADKFRAETLKLGEVAKGSDAGALKVQFAAVAKECKACHDTFRKQ